MFSGQVVQTLRAIALGGLLAAAPALALQPGVRAQEISSCLPGELRTWGDGRDRPVADAPLRLAYQHAGAPPWFSDLQVRARVQQAATAWAECGVPVQMLPPEAAPPWPAGTVRVHWQAPEHSAHFGLAHLGERSLSLGRGAFGLLQARNPSYPALNVLQMVLSHELGHFFGLMAHSSRCVDVMSYYTDAGGQACHTRDGQDHRRLPEYRALLPTACDIQRCRALNAR
jgi:hypothetical protein